LGSDIDAAAYGTLSVMVTGGLIEDKYKREHAEAILQNYHYAYRPKMECRDRDLAPGGDSIQCKAAPRHILYVRDYHEVSFLCPRHAKKWRDDYGDWSTVFDIPEDLYD